MERRLDEALENLSDEGYERLMQLTPHRITMEAFDQVVEMLGIDLQAIAEECARQVGLRQYMESNV